MITSEAVANTRSIVTQAPARAVPPCLIAKAFEDVRATGALFQAAIWSSEAYIANTADVFVSIPRGFVHPAGILRQLPSSVADSSHVAIIQTGRALAGDAIEVFEAVAHACVSVAQASVRALH